MSAVGSPGTEREAVPSYIDPRKASIARVYDAFLGGKDNYEVDREVFHKVQQAAPEAALLAVENRNFLIRATRFIASQTSVDQILDCGSGLPTAENTHQVAQRLNPDIRVVYVDNDPTVLAHGRALLEDEKETFFVDADIFRPADVLENAVVRDKLDFTEPIALFQLGTLHHYDGKPTPEQIMREFIDALPVGSYVAITHFLDPENEHTPVARKMEQMFLHSMMGSGVFRTQQQIEDMFGGLEMIPPGVVPCYQWWPDGPQLKDVDQVQHCIAGGIAVKR